jgi:hypothetical protein
MALGLWSSDKSRIKSAKHRLGAVAPTVSCDHVTVARGSSRAFGGKRRNGDQKMNEFIKGYLDRSHEIIGERTPEEVAHDNEVIKQLRKGRNIKKALKMAAQKSPAEPLHWDEETIGGIAAHYEYLTEHEKITSKLSALTS